MKAILILSLVVLSAYAHIEIKFDFITCIKDGEKIVKDVESFVKDIKSKSKSISGIIGDLEVIFNDIPPFVNDCKFTSEHSSIKRKEMLPADFAYCLKDIEALLSDALKLINDAKAKDITSLIDDVVGFYDGIKQTIQDCKLGSLSDM